MSSKSELELDFIASLCFFFTSFPVLYNTTDFPFFSLSPHFPVFFPQEK